MSVYRLERPTAASITNRAFSLDASLVRLAISDSVTLFASAAIFLLSCFLTDMQVGQVIHIGLVLFGVVALSISAMHVLPHKRLLDWSLVNVLAYRTIVFLPIVGVSALIVVQIGDGSHLALGSTWLALALSLLAVSRALFWQYVHSSTDGVGPRHRVLFIPVSEETLKCESALRGSMGANILESFGFYDREIATVDGSGETQSALLAWPGQIIADTEHLVSQIRQGDIDEVVLADELRHKPELAPILSRLLAIPVNICMSKSLVVANSASMDKLGSPTLSLNGVPLTSVRKLPLCNNSQTIKRIIDVVASGSLLLFLAPVFAFLAILIRLDSRGPIIFRQERKGLYLQPFEILKFRTMHADQTDHQAINQVRKNDPRVTRVGRFLRRTSMDELPQLINILRGDMSLIGPRPHAPKTQIGDTPFSDICPDYDDRYCVRPGLSGWAQVNGFRGPVETREHLDGRVALDLHYIENWSITLDLRIMLRTLGVPFVKAEAW